jgi:hypothetical protein
MQAVFFCFSLAIVLLAIVKLNGLQENDRTTHGETQVAKVSSWNTSATTRTTPSLEVAGLATM